MPVLRLPGLLRRLAALVTPRRAPGALPGEHAASAGTLVVGTTVASAVATLAAGACAPPISATGSSGTGSVDRRFAEADVPTQGRLDSVVTPFSEKFVLTPAESIVVRCDTIRYRRSPGQAPARSSGASGSGGRSSSSGGYDGSRGTGHASHASHASHSSHSSHSSGGWV